MKSCREEPFSRRLSPDCQRLKHGGAGNHILGDFLSAETRVLIPHSHRQAWKHASANGRHPRKASQVIEDRDEIQMLDNHLRPEVRFRFSAWSAKSFSHRLNGHTGFDTAERFAKCHLAKDVERDHLKPLGHVDPLVCGAVLCDGADEAVDAASDNGLLLVQRFGAEC